ncbi:hypothetical protein [Thalassobacillus hwangdonensis]
MILMIGTIIAAYSGLMVFILSKLNSPTAVKIVRLFQGRKQLSFKQKQLNYERMISTR